METSDDGAFPAKGPTRRNHSVARGGTTHPPCTDDHRRDATAGTVRHVIDQSRRSAEGAVLVTGGAGYIGSHTVRALRAAGRDVVVVDSLENGHAENVIDAPLVVGETADRELVRRVIDEHGVGQLVHFAAYKAVGESMERPGMYFRNNVADTVQLLDTCEQAGVTGVVFSSSASVYGTPPENPVTESSPIEPESVYAETKAMVERILAWYGRTSAMQSVSLRYFNAAGASADGRIGEDWAHSQNLIPHVMKAVLVEGSRLRIFGDDYDTPDGTGVRDYIHVEDLADAHVKALEHLADGGETTAVNVGTGVGSSVMDVIAAVSEAAGRPVPYDVVARRAGDPTATVADPSTAERILGWTATRTLDEIARTAYAWHASRVDASN